MAFIDNRSDIEKELSDCYSQIECLQNKIKNLEYQLAEQERISELTKKFQDIPSPTN